MIHTFLNIFIQKNMIDGKYVNFYFNNIVVLVVMIDDIVVVVVIF